MPPNQSTGAARRLLVLGSTGSIGINTLAVVDHLRRERPAEFEIVGLATGGNVQAVLEQARAHEVKHIAIANGGEKELLLDSLRGVRVYRGPDAALELVKSVARRGDLVVGAMVGSAGVPAILEAIDMGCDIALANKETLVAAGALVMPKVRERGVNLLPVDSEHSAIFQCLESSKSRPIELSNAGYEPVDASSGRFCDVARIVLTASGGPFRTWSKSRTEQATVEEALNHPTWNMGPKVTIDSASLMNKALEIVEAHWLFAMPSQKIDVVIHPQSIIHSFVEFVDGSVLAQLGPPDMKTPIQYALMWPRRIEGCSQKTDWSASQRLELEPVDHERFPAPRLAHQVIEAAGTAGAVFNAANECAVAAFLSGQISFGRIAALVEEALESVDSREVHTLDDVVQADQAARRFVNERVNARTGKHAPGPGPVLRSGPA